MSMTSLWAKYREIREISSAILDDQVPIIYRTTTCENQRGIKNLLIFQSLWYTQYMCTIFYHNPYNCYILTEWMSRLLPGLSSSATGAKFENKHLIYLLFLFLGVGE